MRRRVVDLEGDPPVPHLLGRVEHAQAEPCREQERHGPVDGGLVDQALPDRVEQRRVRAAAFQVASHLDCQRRRLSGRLHQAVPAKNVVDGPTIGRHIAPEAPLLTQDLLQQRRTGAARLAVEAVVRAHHRSRLPRHDARLERGQVGFPQVALAHGCIEVMPVALGAAVNREVLRGGDHLEGLRILALQPFDERHTHDRAQVRVLAVGLLPAAPAWVAEDVDVRRPEGEAGVKLAHPAAQRFVVLGTRFVRDGVGHLSHQLDVPRGCHADGLRKNRGDARAGDAVQALIPPAVGGDAQTLDRGRIVDHLRDLLLQGHPGDEVVYALLNGPGGIAVSWGWGEGRCLSRHSWLSQWPGRL